MQTERNRILYIAVLEVVVSGKGTFIFSDLFPEKIG